MARIRTVKPTMWMSPQVMNLSHGARLLFIGLITQADDEGRGIADVRRLKAAVFPGDDILSGAVHEWLGEIAEQGLVRLYEAPGHGRLYQLPSWNRHQSISRPTASDYPAAPGENDDSLSAHGGLHEDSMRTPEGKEGKGRERKGEEGKGGSARAGGLTAERVEEARRLAAGVNPDREWAAFQDWLAKEGKRPADLDAAWRSWLGKVGQFGATGKSREQAALDAKRAEEWDSVRKLGTQAAFRPPHPHETPGSYRTALNHFLRDRPRALA